jgi:hypothetical protein
VTAGAAVIAATFSVGTAAVASADVSDADAASSVIGALDPSAFDAASLLDAALPAATETVPEADAISYLIDALDPAQFTSTGTPAGFFGLVGYFFDNYLFGPTSIDPSVDVFLEPYVLDIVASLTPDAATAATVAVDPVSDLAGAFDPGAFSAFDSVVDGLLGSVALF